MTTAAVADQEPGPLDDQKPAEEVSRRRVPGVGETDALLDKLLAADRRTYSKQKAVPPTATPKLEARGGQSLEDRYWAIRAALMRGGVKDDAECHQMAVEALSKVYGDAFVTKALNDLKHGT